MIIRVASPKDVAACVWLVESRRERYEQYEPRFWRKAANSEALTHEWFSRLFDEDETVSLVSEENSTIVGFLIARNFPVPPVYQPGGPTALIDDFCVNSDDRWLDVGAELLVVARTKLHSRGFAQIIVVGASNDLTKTEFLNGTDLSLASTWWTAKT